MEIVHRLLDRNVDQAQLKSAVAESGAKLETLRQRNSQLKTEEAENPKNGIGDLLPNGVGADRVLCQQLLTKDQVLNKLFKRHEVARERLVEVHREVEHVRR